MRILITEKQYKFLKESITPVENIVDGIWGAVSGLGTNEEDFYTLLRQIKNQSTLNLVNKGLLDKHKQSFYDVVNEPLEFNEQEKNIIAQILTKNDLPHKVVKGKIVPIKINNFKNVNTLNPSEKLISFLMYEEGSAKQKGEPELVSYKKKGDKWTIGYGHTSNVRPNMKITKDIAIKFLKQDLIEASNCVKRIFSEWAAKGIKINLTQSMFDTLVSLTFNAGCGSIRGTESGGEVIDHIKAGQFYTAAQKIKNFKLKSGFSGLIARREKESRSYKRS